MIALIRNFDRIPLTSDEQVIRFIVIAVILIGFMFAMFYASYRAGGNK